LRIRSKTIRHFLLSLVGPLGIDVTERTPVADLRRLISALKPLESNLVRVGPDGDGGYLIPDDLDGIQYAFSPGVSTESGFEAELARRGMIVFMADYSVDQPAEKHRNFVFDKKFVGCVSNERFMTMDEWKRNHIPDHDGDLLLQMDIEGFEYETILSMSADLLAQFRIIVVEFHFIEQWLCRPHFELVSRAFEKLLQSHSVVHIHPNNVAGSIRTQGLELPRIIETTLLRNDRISTRLPAKRFPHPLDSDNTDNSTLTLPECWYR
jgi:hypothetical protein